MSKIADRDAECAAMENEIEKLKALRKVWFCLGWICGATAMAVCDWLLR